jgi:DNA-directed RNA polymerase subunit RPC12/RpoP
MLLNKQNLMVQLLVDDSEGPVCEDNTSDTLAYTCYDEVSGKWVCRTCSNVNESPPDEDGDIKCGVCGSVSKETSIISDYNAFMGICVDFWCPICEDFVSGAEINEENQVKCEACNRGIMSL